MVALANVTLLMWEYHKGAFEKTVHASEQEFLQNQEEIMLVSELKRDLLTTLQTRNPQSGEDAPLLPTKSDVNGIDKVIIENPSLGLKLNDPAIVLTGNPQEDDKNSGENPVICYEIGPFASDKAYQAWINQLTAVKDNIKPVIKDEQVVSDYLVYYPAAETLIQAEANMQMLKDHGVNDLWLLRTGEEKGQISLGVFNKEERALIMKNQLLAKGINAEVKARYKSKPQKYALIQGDNKIMDSLAVLKKAHPEFTVIQRPSLTDGCL